MRKMSSKVRMLKIIQDYLETVKDSLEVRALESDDFMLRQMYDNAREHVELALEEVKEIIKLER